MAVSNLTMASVVEAHGSAWTGSTSVAVCRERGCTIEGSIQCAYVDSHGRPCTTHWCPRHLHLVGTDGYCRRHASTVAALGGKANDPRTLPPVDYRGASLVSWICTEGLLALHRAVASELRPGEILFDDPTINVVRLADSQRRWERGWRIGDRNGLTSRVLICVDESDDALVSLKVDDAVVAVAVPPWITRRRRGQKVGPDTDAADRQQFYGFLINHICQALAARP
jgi:hypothetical protein